jgi:hypothetical protein
LQLRPSPRRTSSKRCEAVLLTEVEGGAGMEV